MNNHITRKGKRFFAPTLAAGFMLAMALTFISCANNDEEGGNSSGSNNGGGGFSSSSGGSNSGGSGPCGKLMSTNLNVDVAGSVCYDNDPSNCSKYGRLYDWATAMNLPAKCNVTRSTNDQDCAIQSNHRGICPSGQHIPSKEELDEYGSYECLKNQPGGNGNRGSFQSVGDSGIWWSASEHEQLNISAYYWFMSYNYEDVSLERNVKDRLFSVRCVED